MDPIRGIKDTDRSKIVTQSPQMSSSSVTACYIQLMKHCRPSSGQKTVTWILQRKFSQRSVERQPSRSPLLCTVHLRYELWHIVPRVANPTEGRTCVCTYEFPWECGKPEVNWIQQLSKNYGAAMPLTISDASSSSRRCSTAELVCALTAFKKMSA
jgi:hypothetical protein